MTAGVVSGAGAGMRGVDLAIEKIGSKVKPT